MRQAMKEVYLPTKDETRDFKNSPLLKDFKNSPLLNDLLSKPASLKNLCRNSLRKSMRILTEGRTIRPLVASLENSLYLPKTLGNFLLCDPPVNWRKEMVIKIKSDCLFVNICVLGSSVKTDSSLLQPKKKAETH